jgi:hypothetical protein
VHLFQELLNLTLQIIFDANGLFVMLATVPVKWFFLRGFL